MDIHIYQLTHLLSFRLFSTSKYTVVVSVDTPNRANDTAPATSSDIRKKRFIFSLAPLHSLGRSAIRGDGDGHHRRRRCLFTIINSTDHMWEYWRKLLHQTPNDISPRGFTRCTLYQCAMHTCVCATVCTPGTGHV